MEAEEKIQKALYKINNAGVDRAKEDQKIREKIEQWEEKQEELAKVEKRLKQRQGLVERTDSFN